MSKQVIVMRTDLGMRKGKMIAQGAHASMKVFFDRGTVIERTNQGRPEDRLEVGLTPVMSEWVRNFFTKVCVRAESEEQLLDLHRQALEAGLPCSLVEDRGKTEFHGVVTPTCIAIGPADPAQIDLITGNLRLL